MSALDGSKTYRLGHTHEPDGYDYKAQTQPSHSPDGGRVIFASAWGGSGSAPAAGRLLCRGFQNLTPQDPMSNALIVRSSFANPLWWGWHRFLFWEATRRGVMI